MLCRHRACPQKLGRRHCHVCCRHLLLLCRHRACPKNCGAGIAMSAAGTCFCFAGIARVLKKLRRRHRHVCCRHLLMLCRHRASPKKWGAGIDMSAAGTCLCFAGIAFMWKNRAQAPHPVWGLKNLKERRCRGEGVANATAVRIEGSIVCQTCCQTGAGS